MKKKGNGYQVIKTIKTFEYENTRSVAITDKNEKQYVRQIIQLGMYTRDPRGIFR